MVVGVAAVRTGHRDHRVVAGASLADGVEHADDVVDDPHPDGAAQVVEAVDVVVQRRALGAELVGQSVDGQRVPAVAVEEGQRGVDDGVATELGGPRRGLGSTARRRAAPADLPCVPFPSVVFRVLLLVSTNWYRRMTLTARPAGRVSSRGPGSAGRVARRPCTGRAASPGFTVWIDQVMTSLALRHVDAAGVVVVGLETLVAVERQLGERAARPCARACVRCRGRCRGTTTSRCPCRRRTSPMHGVLLPEAARVVVDDLREQRGADRLGDVRVGDAVAVHRAEPGAVGASDGDCASGCRAAAGEHRDGEHRG